LGQHLPESGRIISTTREAATHANNRYFIFPCFGIHPALLYIQMAAGRLNVVSLPPCDDGRDVVYAAARITKGISWPGERSADIR
jgi:hypothetical protein